MSNGIAVNLLFNAVMGGTVGTVFKGIKQRAQATRAELGKLRRQESIVANLTKYREQLDALQTAQRAGVADGSLVAAQLASTTKQYEAARAKAAQYGINLGKLGQEHARLREQIGWTTRALERQQTRLANRETRKELRGQLMGTLGTVLAVAAPVKAAIDFESTMADVKKVVSFDTPEQFRQMTQEVLGLSAAMPMAATGIGAIVAAAGQAGIARGELMEFARAAVTMGVAFDLTGDEAGAMMANWRAGMNLSQAQAVRLADSVNHLSNNLNAQAGALGEVLQRQGAVAMAAGLTETQTAALGAALLSSGTGPERAATALKNLTGALTKGYAATKAQQDAFAALGLDAEDLAAAMQNDAQGAIVEVFEALRNAAPEERGALVSELFGEESKGAIMPLLTNLGNLRKAFGLVANEADFTGSMQAEYEERSKTTANQLQLLRNRAAALGVTLGSVLLPTVNRIAGAVGAVAGWVTKGAEQFPRLTTGVVAAATGLAAFRVAMLASRYAVTVFSDAKQVLTAAIDLFCSGVLRSTLALTWHKVATAATTVGHWGAVAAIKAWTAAQWLLNAAMTANPIGLLIVGIGALIGLGTLLWKHWAKVGEFFQGLKSKFGWIGNLFGGASWGDPAQAAEVSASPGRGLRAATLGAALAVAPGAGLAALPELPPPAGRASVTSTVNVTMNVTVAPGKEREMADEIARALAEQQRRAEAEARGGLYDGAGGA